jgi:ABC-type branched-subunit amino acid transport system substrate-binding protein
MNEVQKRSAPRRTQIPTLVAGLIIGVLVAAGIAPLVGSDHGTTQVGTPGFLSGSKAAGDTASTDATSVGGGDGASGGAVANSASGGGAATGGGGATRATAAGGGARSGLAATDVGVTATAIRVGFITQNCKGCAALGMTLTPTSSADLAQTFVADLNARGGILGRKVEGYTADYDPVNDAINGGGEQRAACLQLTENDKVFAVLNGGTKPNDCIYTEHKTPLITGLEPLADDPGTFNANEGRLWTIGASGARTLLNWARQAARQDLVSTSPTKPFGIVVNEAGEATVRKYLIPELERLGRHPAHVSAMPSNTATAPTVASTESAKMRSAGINTVMLALDPVTSAVWIQQAEADGWKPQYLSSEYPVSVSDYTGGLQPASYQGAIAIANTPVTPAAQLRAEPLVHQCLAVWEKHIGGPTADADIGAVVSYCSAVRLFEAAAKRAGTNLTRNGFDQGMAGLGTFPMGNIVGNKVTFGSAYSLGPVKWSGADSQNTEVWTSPCPYQDSDNKCWVVTHGPEPMAA